MSDEVTITMQPGPPTNKPTKTDGPPSGSTEHEAQLTFEVEYGPNVKTVAVQEVVFRPPVSLEVNEFDRDSAKAFETGVAAALRSRQPILPVTIDSFGGEIYALNRMLDAIRAAQQRGLSVVTIANSKAMSCGAILLAAGDRRYVARDAIVMIHDAWSFEWGKTSELRENVKHVEYLDSRGYEILDVASGKPSGYWKQRVHDIGHADLYLTSLECLQTGLATNIGVPNLGLRVALDYTLDGVSIEER